jgi:hypothetical protein
MEHLFLSCPFAAECWSKISVSITAQNNIFNAIQNIKDQSHPQFFMVMAILMSWSIWTARNNLIFRGIQQNPDSVKANFDKELKITALRAKTRFAAAFDSWIEYLL